MTSRVFSFLIASLAISILGPIPAHASEQDVIDCNQKADRDRAKAGCSRLIEQGATNQNNRVNAYFNRGVAYDE